MKKQKLNEEFKKMQKLAGLNELGEGIPFSQWKSSIIDFIQTNLTQDIDELDMLNDVLKEIVADNEQELSNLN